MTPKSIAAPHDVSLALKCKTKLDHLKQEPDVPRYRTITNLSKSETCVHPKLRHNLLKLLGEINYMDRIKDHFNSEAQEFDRIILTLIPYYPEMIRALVQAIPFDRSMPLRIIDLGCGTGTAAAKVLELFPAAQITCLDLSENMITVARARLAHYPRVKYVVADISSFDFDSQYDVAISSLALHHLATDKDKQGFYRRIFENLSPGGAFYNADFVLASNDFLQDAYMEKWREFMSCSLSKDEIEGKWIPKYLEEDHPAKLVDQLAWMTEIGFVDVDVIWKYYGFAVYGGVRR
jgi:tRNA (cmo5U34)-methyltransferase